MTFIGGRGGIDSAPPHPPGRAFARSVSASLRLEQRSHPTQRLLDLAPLDLAEGVGFAQILLDLTASFAPLNRVIKHYQRVFGT